ncbi:hypothetical protein AB4225_29555 [Streptomyces sp. 2RAF24]
MQLPAARAQAQRVDLVQQRGGPLRELACAWRARSSSAVPVNTVSP